MYIYIYIYGIPYKQNLSSGLSAGRIFVREVHLVSNKPGSWWLALPPSISWTYINCMYLHIYIYTYTYIYIYTYTYIYTCVYSISVKIMNIHIYKHSIIQYYITILGWRWYSNSQTWSLYPFVAVINMLYNSICGEARLRFLQCELFTYVNYVHVQLYDSQNEGSHVYLNSLAYNRCKIYHIHIHVEKD